MCSSHLITTDWKEFFSDNYHLTRAGSPDPDAAFRGSVCMMHIAAPQCGHYSLFLENASLRPGSMNSNGESPSFMKHKLPVYTITRATGFMAGTVIDQDSNSIQQNLLLVFKSVAKP